MEIEVAIHEAIKGYIESDKFKEVIKKQAEEMVDDAVKSCIRSYGGMSEDIKIAVKEAFKFDVEELGLNGYNKFICDVVKQSIEAKMIAEPIQNEINKIIDEVTAPMEKTIKFDEILKKLLVTVDSDFEHYRSLEGYLEDHSFRDYCTVIIEQPEDDRYDWINIYLSECKNKDRWTCEFALCVHKSFTSFKINGRDLTPREKLCSPYMNELEKLMYKMFLNEVHVDRESIKEWEDCF